VANRPAGWYPSPALPGRERFWDGGAWTDHFRDVPPSPPGDTSSDRQRPATPSAAPPGSMPSAASVLHPPPPPPPQLRAVPPPPRARRAATPFAANPIAHGAVKAVTARWAAVPPKRRMAALVVLGLLVGIPFLALRGGGLSDSSTCAQYHDASIDDQQAYLRDHGDDVGNERGQAVENVLTPSCGQFPGSNLGYTRQGAENVVDSGGP
jgi:hypothetical protein